MAWAGEDVEEVTTGYAGKTFELGENQRAHVQVVRKSGGGGPIDVWPQTSTNPSRGGDVWDDKPYRPFRIYGGDNVGSGFIQGPRYFQVRLVDPLSGTPIVCDVCVEVTGA